MPDSQKILIVSEAHLINTFVTPTIEQLQVEAAVTFDCFVVSPLAKKDRAKLEQTYNSVYSNEYKHLPFTKFRKVGAIQMFANLRKIARSLPHYDIIHINYHYFYTAYFSHILRKKTEKLFITFYGSDFNAAGIFEHLHNFQSIKIADGVFTTNPVMLTKISKKYNLDKGLIAMDILFPKMTTFDKFKNFVEQTSIDEAHRVFGVEKKILTCGYSAASIVQHMRIINALVKTRHQLKGIQVIFPMTYGAGGEQNRMQVRKRLKELNLSAMVIERYLPIDEALALRLATDVFIHIQLRDQLSASMLEHLAAGSVVITGKWLPYDLLREKGAYIIWLDHEDELAEVLAEVLQNLDFHKENASKNREIVIEIVEWKNIRKNWYKYYGLKMTVDERV